VLARGLARFGLRVRHQTFFDTVRIDGTAAEVSKWMQAAAARRMNLRRLSNESVTIALDETTTPSDVERLWELFGHNDKEHGAISVAALARESSLSLPWAGAAARTSAYLTHPIFNTHHSETEMLRYMRRLEARDLSLTSSMIPLGSCTMKLNATAEMMPVT